MVSVFRYMAEVVTSLEYNYSSAYHSLTVAPMVSFVHALVLFQLFLNLDRYIAEGARVAEDELHPPFSPEFTFCDELYS